MDSTPKVQLPLSAAPQGQVKSQKKQESWVSNFLHGDRYSQKFRVQAGECCGEVAQGLRVVREEAPDLGRGGQGRLPGGG